MPLVVIILMHHSGDRRRYGRHVCLAVFILTLFMSWFVTPCDLGASLLHRSTFHSLGIKGHRIQGTCCNEPSIAVGAFAGLWMSCVVAAFMHDLRLRSKGGGGNGFSCAESLLFAAGTAALFFASEGHLARIINVVGGGAPWELSSVHKQVVSIVIRLMTGYSMLFMCIFS